jgi:hypothetical protein
MLVDPKEIFFLVFMKARRVYFRSSATWSICNLLIHLTHIWTDTDVSLRSIPDGSLLPGIWSIPQAPVPSLFAIPSSGTNHSPACHMLPSVVWTVELHSTVGPVCCAGCAWGAAARWWVMTPCGRHPLVSTPRAETAEMPQLSIYLQLFPMPSLSVPISFPKILHPANSHHITFP